MLHELFLITRQKTKIRNTFANNPLTDLKLSKYQLSKKIQSVGFLGNITGNLCKKAPLKFCVPLAKDILPQLATKATSSAIDNFERK